MTRHLLDVNVLLALSLPTHQHHALATNWFAQGRDWSSTPVTETAYVRLMCNRFVIGFDVPATAALQALTTMRNTRGHAFLPDESSFAEPHIDVSTLVGPKQVTSFHLLNLAAGADQIFTTLDQSFGRSVSAQDQRHLLILVD